MYILRSPCTRVRCWRIAQRRKKAFIGRDPAFEGGKSWRRLAFNVPVCKSYTFPGRERERGKCSRPSSSSRVSAFTEVNIKCPEKKFPFSSNLEFYSASLGRSSTHCLCLCLIFLPSAPCWRFSSHCLRAQRERERENGERERENGEEKIAKVLLMWDFFLSLCTEHTHASVHTRAYSQSLSTGISCMMLVAAAVRTTHMYTLLHEKTASLG